MSSAGVEFESQSDQMRPRGTAPSVRLLRVFLPGNHTTLLQANVEMTMESILETVCDKKMLNPAEHEIVMRMGTNDIVALPNDQYGLYSTAEEVRLRKKNVDESSNTMAPPQFNRRRSSVQMSSPVKMEVKHGNADFPELVTGRKAKRNSKLGTLRGMFGKNEEKRKSLLGNESMTASAASSIGDVSGNSRKSPTTNSPRVVSPLYTLQTERDMTRISSRESFASSVSAWDSEETGPSDSSDFLATPADIQFRARKRLSTAGKASSQLKRTSFRSRAVSEESAANRSLVSLDDDQSEFILIRLTYKDQKSTLKIAPESHVEAVLRQACNLFNLDFETHALERHNGAKMYLDKTLNFYQTDSKLNEFTIFEGEKSYSSISIVENGEEVMVLSTETQLVMAGSPDKLVGRLTDDAADINYIESFLMTYRDYITPVEVFDEIIARFNSVLPDNPSEEDIEYYEKNRGIVQHRVIKILQHWANNHWHDFENNAELKSDLLDFVEVISGVDAFETYGDALDETIARQSIREERLQELRASIEGKRKTMESMFDSIEVEELAQQLTIHDFALFQNIHPVEFLNQIWRKKDFGPEWSTPNLDFFSTRFDIESYWVATEILSQKDLKKRVHYLKRFVKLSKDCLELCNYFSMFSIYVGLNMTPIQRLKKTWENLAPKYKAMYDEIEKVCDTSKNMKNYRDLLATSPQPVLPFMPIYLKDLTFINDGNPSKYKGLINFDKLRMMADRVRDITDLSRIPYEFTPIPQVQNYLNKPQYENELGETHG